MYEKLEKQSLEPFWDRPRRLLGRHSDSKSEMFPLLCHVIVVNVEHHMLPQLSLSSNCEVVGSILLAIAHELFERRVVPDVNRQSSRHPDYHRRKDQI